MTAPVPSTSYASQLAVGGTGIDFISADIGLDEQILDAPGMWGSRSRHVERTRPTLQRVGGPLELQPNDSEMKILLPWILGKADAGGTYALAETLMTNTVIIDRVAQVHTYTGCAIDTAKFHCAQGEPLKVSLGVVGLTETLGSAGTFPNTTETVTSGPFILSDLVAVVGGTTIYMKQMDVTINNHIDKDRFFNRNTLSAILANDRTVTFSTEVPYDTNLNAIYGSGSGGVTITATFTNGDNTFEMSMVAVVFPRKPINVPNRAELMLPISGDCYQSGTGGGATKEIVITMDS